MIKEEHSCVGCPPHMRCCPCPESTEMLTICDDCGWEEDLYDYYGEQLCDDCLIKRLTLSDKDECEFCDNVDEPMYDLYENGEARCLNCIHEKLGGRINPYDYF